MISDFRVSVEAGPSVHVELAISSVEYMGDAMGLEGPLVFGCIPEWEKHNFLSNADTKSKR